MTLANTPILLAQCKAYQSLEEITKAIENLIHIDSTRDFNVHISLPYSYIEPISKKFADKNIQVGAETLLDADEGSFTAPIVGKMIDEVKAKFVLIGTAQDRTSHSSGSHHLKNKIKATLRSQAKPFICVGETLQEHQDNLSKEVLTSQLRDCVEGFSPEELKKIHLVYNAEWISRTPWEATSPELHDAYKIFKEVVEETFTPGIITSDQLIIAVPAYAEEGSKLIESLQSSPNTFSGYSIGVLGLSSEFLQPLKLNKNSLPNPEGQLKPSEPSP